MKDLYIETAALGAFNNKIRTNVTYDKVLGHNVAYDKIGTLKNKYRFIVNTKYKTVKIVDIKDIYPIDELPEEYEGYIQQDDLKKIF